jgi:hypothetical protein
MDTKEWRVIELGIRAEQLRSALESGTEYDLTQAALGMRLFVEEIDPQRRRLLDEAGALRLLFADVLSSMDQLDTESVREFVELVKESR